MLRPLQENMTTMIRVIEGTKKKKKRTKQNLVIE